MPVWEITLVIALLFAIVSTGIWIWNVYAAKKRQIKKQHTNTKYINVH